MIGKVTRGLGAAGLDPARFARLGGLAGAPQAGEGRGSGAWRGGGLAGWARWGGAHAGCGRRGARPECVAAGCRGFHHLDCHEGFL